MLAKYFYVSALVLASTASASASTPLHGNWVEKNNPTVTMSINGNVATVNAECEGRSGESGGSFKAVVHESHHLVTLNGPVPSHPDFDSFTIHFKEENGELMEVAPYPVDNLQGIGAWVGQGCGFGLESGSATQKSHPSIFYRQKG